MPNTMLTTEQVETLWRAARELPFLAEMCERWLDGEGAVRAAADETIREYVRESQVGAAVGL